MRTIEEVAQSPQKGDVVIFTTGRIRWTVRAFLEVPQNGVLVIADREEVFREEPYYRRKEKVAIHPTTWGDLVRSAAVTVESI